MTKATRYTGLIQHYAGRLPIDDPADAISLGEGRTPCIRTYNLPRRLGFEGEIYLKFEGLNPTGSFKDRGMTVAVTKAFEEGSRAVVCASTGNTSASAAAYAARAGMTAFVIIPEGKIALGKLSQAMMHGAKVIQIRGNFDDAMEIVRELAEDYPITLVNSINPHRLQGQKTAAFEVVEELGRAPDYHALPVGNAGNITAYWMGYSEYAEEDRCGKPVMLGFQASGSAPIIEGHRIGSPDTVATAIRIGNPASWDSALRVQQESGGWFDSVQDAQILEAQKLLASTDGVFCEPASAASVAGVVAEIQEGRIPQGSTVVCTLTGHGLKDPDTAIEQSDQPYTVDATESAVEGVIKAFI
ncbi:threonine synthase [Thiohalorhabdus methylotrophus]|uniref:Threonine synthase n=1 Tax=Thiohalorhabdus methylotrophus TaxID=3242694 RepID=A0ABV4TWK8_9GAMM